MKKNNCKSGIGKFILGATVGAALGVLFAPKSGSKTRAELKKKAVELINKAKEIDVKEVKENIEDKVVSLMEEIKELDKEKVYEIAKKKASDLKKNAENLVVYTKEKATPVVHDAADALRKKAIDVTKSVLDKLEAK